MKKLTNTLVFFADNWDYRWRRRQQLASGLARSGIFEKVVYVERPLTLTSFIKYLFGSADWDGTNRWREVLRQRSWIRKISGTLDIFTTFALLPAMNNPLLFCLGENLRDYWFLKMIKKYYKLDRPIIWVSHPQISIAQIKALCPSLIMYDCTEDFSAWPDIYDCVRNQIKETDSYLTKNAGVITTVSRVLFAEKKKLNPDTYLLPNAVDIDLYILPKEEYPIPTDIKTAKHPIITFVGAMQEWSNDWDLLVQMVTLRPEWTFLLIGPLQSNRLYLDILKPHKNIICLGQKPYVELPAYLIYSDACFQFYRPARENDTRSSQKLYLYLAAGKPVVSTRSADASNYAEYVFLADDAEAFIDGIENEIKNDSQEKISKRKEFARKNSWANRVEEIVSILGSKGVIYGES